jgi:hypothetical protein
VAKLACKKTDLQVILGCYFIEVGKMNTLSYVLVSYAKDRLIPGRRHKLCLERQAPVSQAGLINAIAIKSTLNY